MTLLDQVLRTGYAVVRLDPEETHRLGRLYRSAAQFFARESAEKERHSVPNRANGYREHGYAHSGSYETPDQNDSFLYWPDRRDALPDHAEIEGLLDDFEGHRRTTARIVQQLISELSAHYGYAAELPFEAASVLQVNSFAQPSDRELLQHRHEDAVFVTVISTNARGLEIYLDDRKPDEPDPEADGGPVTPLGDGLAEVVFSADELLIMPGGVLTDMTGGEIPPLYHQARNHGLLERMSVMYFVSPDVSGPVEAFRITDQNRDLDIRQRIIDNPQTFGLSQEFLAA